MDRKGACFVQPTQKLTLMTGQASFSGRSDRCGTLSISAGAIAINGTSNCFFQGRLIKGLIN